MHAKCGVCIEMLFLEVYCSHVEKSGWPPAQHACSAGCLTAGRVYRRHQKYDVTSTRGAGNGPIRPRSRRAPLGPIAHANGATWTGNGRRLLDAPKHSTCRKRIAPLAKHSQFGPFSEHSGGFLNHAYFNILTVGLVQ